MTYTQTQIDRANAANLEDFLRAQGETLVRSGKEYRWKVHDSLTVCGNKWFRHSQSKGGFPVDFVMEFYGKSFPEAVQMLTGEPGEAQPEADPAPSPAFRLPLRNVTNANILNYLTQERKLSPSLVNFFIAAGDIYEDAAHHNVVFVGRDADGHPRYASNRGIREKFRQDAAGAEKAFGFAHRGTDKQLLIFEAPIDLLSFIELFPKNWQQHSYLSLGGVSGKALRQFLSEHPDVERVFLCLDADKAGEDAFKRLSALLPDTVSVTRIQPCMKDWNDVLVHRAEIPNRNYFKSIVLKEPSKPETVKMRILTHEKSSLAPPGVSLAFSLGDEGGFRWVGEYDITADEMLSGIEPQRETKTQQAKDLICALLAGGKQVLSEDIDKAALERGIPGRTVRDAKRELGDALKSKIVEGRKKIFWME